MKTMTNPDQENMRRRLVAAEAIAATLLLAPHESADERQAARDEAASLILKAGELLVRGGCDQLAMAAHDLVARIDSAAR
jgi:hypothetical protein